MRSSATEILLSLTEHIRYIAHARQNQDNSYMQTTPYHVACPRARKFSVGQSALGL